MWIGHRKEIWKLTFRALALRSVEGLTLKTSASESLCGGQFTLLTQLIKSNCLVILPPTQHHSFFRNLPPLLQQRLAEDAILASYSWFQHITLLHCAIRAQDPGWTILTNSEEFVYSVICDNRCKDTLCVEILAGFDFLQLLNKFLFKSYAFP